MLSLSANAQPLQRYACPSARVSATPPYCVFYRSSKPLHHRRQHTLSPILLPLSQQPAVTRVSQQEHASTSEQQPAQVEAPVTPWWEREAAPNMVDVHGVQHLVDVMAECGDRLVILDFYAPWCNACRALYPKFVKLLSKHQEDTVFLKINWEENRDIARMLDIKVLPYFQFYRGAEGKVDQFSCTVSKITRFKDALDLYSGSFCSLDDAPYLAEFPDVKPSRKYEEELPGNAGDPDRPTEVRSLWWS